MTKLNIELKDIFYAADDEPALPAREVPDALDKFMETATLAGAIGRGGNQFAHNLEIETADRDKKLAAHYKKIADSATKPATPAPAGTDTDLAKSFSPSGRRKASLREFLKGHLALGTSAQSVIDYARQHDAFTANLLTEIARELNAL